MSDDDDELWMPWPLFFTSAPVLLAVLWVIPGARVLADQGTAGIVAAVSGVLVALIGAWAEGARQSLRERMAKLEGRVDALEKR